MLTGRLPSAIGVVRQRRRAARRVPTIAHLLRAAGYRTALAGKMHFVGPDQLHGFEERLTTDIYPADFDWTPDWGLAPDERLAWYHNMSSVRDAGPVRCRGPDRLRRRGVRPLGRAMAARARAHGRLAPVLPDVSFTTRTTRGMRGRRLGAYADVEIDLPRVPAIPRRAPIRRRAAARHARREREPRRRRQVRAARRAYYGAVSLRRRRSSAGCSSARGAGSTTTRWSIFTADHGEMLGERGALVQDELLRGLGAGAADRARPGLGSRRVGGPVSLLDLAPTLAELAGARDRRATALDWGRAARRGRRPTGRCASTWPRARRRRR